MDVSTPEDLANSAATAPVYSDVSYGGAAPSATPAAPQAPGVVYGVTPKQIETARAAGYSDEAIVQHLATVTTVPIAEAQKQGYSASDILNYLVTPPPSAPTPEEPGVTATAVHELERQALPAVGGFAGFEAAAPVGAKLGALAGAAIPGLGETGIPEAIGGTVGGFAAGAFGAFGGGEVVQKAQQFVMDLIPDNIKKAIGQSDDQQQAERLAHPYIQTAVDLASNLAFVRPGSVANDLREGATAFEKMMASPVGSRVAGAGFMTGMEAGQEEIHDGELDPKKLLIASVVGALSNKKTALGEGIEKGVQRLGAKFAPSVYRSAGTEAAPGATPPANEPNVISDQEIENRLNASDTPAATDQKIVDAVTNPAVDLDTAIDTAKAAAEGAPVSQTDNIAAKTQALDAAAPEPPAEPFPGLNAGSIEKVDDDTYNFNSKGPDGQVVATPLKVWNPETAPQSDTTISPELADAQRDHYGKLGVDVVYFEGGDHIPFDGAVDPTQPNTLFLSNDPQRNAEQVGAHEVTHVLESTKLPDGTSLGDLLHQQVRANITDTGWDYAKEQFGVSAPQREDFAPGAAGDTAHEQATTVHLIKELTADIGGEAPKFDTFFPKVMTEVENRYGKGVVTDVLQKVMDGIKAAMDTIKKFFGSDSEDTISQHLVNNLDEIHDTIAKMYAAKIGEAHGLEDTTPVEHAPAPEVTPVAGESPADRAARLAELGIREISPEASRAAPDYVQKANTALATEIPNEAPADRAARLAAVGVREIQPETKFSPRQTGTLEFKNWFGNSKATDDEGKPIVAYHGTSKDKDFNSINVNKNGAWFTTDPLGASEYAENNDSQGYRWENGKPEPTNTASRVLPVYLKAENPKVYADPKVFNNEIHRLGGENYKRGQGFLFDKLRHEGFDSVVLKGSDGHDVWVALKDSTQVKSALGNNGNFNPAKKNIQFRPKTAKEGISQPGKDVEDKNVHGFAPSLRVKVNNPPEFATNKNGEPVALMMQTTTNGNAERQIGHLDTILSKFRNPTASPEEWSRMMAYALGSDEVPVPPYAFIRDLSDGGAAKKIESLSSGQISDANHGFEQAAAFRKAYESGQIGPVTTGKLFLWSFLSRGVSPYVQEGLFIDAFDGAAPWIQKTADGNFTKDDLAAYEAWARTAAPKGSGQPGAGATHNLNAFGANFLLNMSEKGADGRSHFQALHDMFSDPKMTGQQIRREFMKFGEGVGIDNKVVSFTLLVAGHPDVMVIDRVQTRQLWDDGRFEGVNIYDGQKNAEGKVITGTPLANLTYGARGLLAYEAIERGLQAKIGEIYEAAGRPQDASVGRYHWESWVAYSQQEASHGTLQAILDDALRPGDKSAIVGVAAKQGEYGAYEYGARYGRGADGQPYFSYKTPTGKEYEFSVPAFRAFLTDIKRPAEGVVPAKFKVTDSGNGPWYDRPEVNRQQLDAVADKYADRNGAGSLLRSGESADLSGGPERGGPAVRKNASGVQFSPRRDEQAFLAVRRARADRTGDEGSSFSFTRRSRSDGGSPRVLKSLGVSYDAEWKAGPGLRKALTEGGIKVPLRVLELHPNDANAAAYEKAISKAKADNKFGASVAVYKPEEYKTFKLLLSDDGKSGAAVKPDGDIVSVFGGDKSGHAILEAAIAAGGRKLDAFDTILPKYYHMHGFVEAARVPWDDAQKPEGWDKATFDKFNKGEPDVVLMALDRNDTSPILEKAPTFTNWDEAAAAQEKMVNRFDREAPGAIVNLRLDRKDGGEPTKLSDAKAEIEKTGAQVIAQRTRKISGAEGEPGVVMHLSRPLSKEEGFKVSDKLKQDAISQYANGRGDVFGPRAEKWGAFDASKFHTLEEGQSLHSPRLTPEQIERLTKLNPDFAKMFRKNKIEVPATEQKAPVEEPKAGKTKEPPKAESAAPKAEAKPAAEKGQRQLNVKHIEGDKEYIGRALNNELTRRLANAPQVEKANEVIAKDRERAMRIAMREEQPPDSWKLQPSVVWTELERQAIRADDRETQRVLRTSPLAKELTTAGRLIQSMSLRDKFSANDRIDEVSEAREAAAKDAAEKSHGSLEAAQKETAAKAEPELTKAIKAQVKKRLPPIQEFANFINSIKCD